MGSKKQSPSSLGAVVASGAMSGGQEELQQVRVSVGSVHPSALFGAGQPLLDVAQIEGSSPPLSQAAAELLRYFSQPPLRDDNIGESQPHEDSMERDRVDRVSPFP